MTESDISFSSSLAKLLPTFDEEEEEDEEINIDDFTDNPTSPPASARPAILANLVESSPVIEQRPSILAGFAATPEKAPEPPKQAEKPPQAAPVPAASTSAAPIVRTPSQPKVVATPLPKGLPDELKRCLALSVQTLLLAPSSLTKNNITNEIKGYCSAIGSEGPILKFSELFGPISAPDVYIPRKKPKITHKNDGLVYEPDEVAKFKVPMVLPEETEVQEEVVVVPEEVKNMANPLNAKVEIGKIPEIALKPLEQDDWEDKVAWDPSQALELRKVTSFNLMTPGATPGQTPGPQPTPELIPNFPRKESFFIPPTATKVPKKPKFIEPEPLWSKPVKKGLWGEVTSSSSTPTMHNNNNKEDDIFDEVVEASSDMFRSMPMPDQSKKKSNGTTSTTTAAAASSTTNTTALFRSINAELLQGDWVKSILWDDSTPPEKPFPTQLLLDLNDPFVFPEDITKPQQPRSDAKPVTRKRKDAEQDDVDKFNLSNDRYYRSNANASKKRSSLRKAMVHHSEPALKLTYVKPHLTEEDLGNFHRPRSWFSSGERYRMGPFRKEKTPKNVKKPVAPAQPVVVHQRNENVMKTRADLSGKEGRVVLMEYIEENPLIVSNFGMGTKVKNYYRKKNATENPLLKFEDGENVLLDHQDESPFMGDIEPGKSVQALDNNLFRAPLVKHSPAETDFLLIKNGRRMIIREIPALYVVGQIQPKMEVYAPNSRAANAYIKNRLQGYIYRLFMKKSVNHRLKISDIMALFPGNSETSIRKRLKDCADFQRGGDDSGWWTVKDQSQLPSEEELRAMVTPEMCCLWESMLAGQYRLQQANVRRHANITPAIQQAVQQLEAEAEDTIARAARWVEDELQLTPWNLSSNFVATIQGKGLLQLTGFGDPSGQRGEAFSYLRLPQKAPSGPKKKDTTATQKSQVTGTDADLRKLSLENSRLVLLKFGVPDSEIQKLGRWERIALVRKKSSEAAMSGEGGNTKFARGTRYSVQEQQHQYKEQVQLIWDNQMKALSETVTEFSDDEANEEDFEDLEEFSKTLESSLEHKKNLRIAREREEEEEREEFEKLKDLTEDKKDDDNSQVKKIIRRTVTITHPDGTQEKRSEIIKDPKLIEELLKRDEERKRQRILQGGNPKKARPALTPEELEEKERNRKERRRLQEQLRRLKKNKEKQEELKEKMMLMQGQGLAEDDPNAIKCGACGLVGHMRTNRCCPMFDPNQVDDTRRDPVTGISINPELVRVEGGKIRVPRNALEKPDLKLRVKLKDLPPGTEKRLREEQEALNRPRRRRRTIPKAQITFCAKLDEVWKDINAYDVVYPFAEPVSTKIAPDYYEIIKNPMDLKTIRNKIKTFDYRTRDEFIADVKLMVSNCHLYNGDQHLLSAHADNILQIAINSIAKRQKELEDLEKAQTEPEKNSDEEDEEEEEEEEVEPPPEDPYDDEDIEIIE